MKLTKYEVSGLLDSWCYLQILSGAIDKQCVVSGLPAGLEDKYFPKGRLKLARGLAQKALKGINKIICRPDFDENCAKTRRKK